MVDGIICTGGAARFKPWSELTDEDWTFSLANKLLGQVNVVRYGLKSVRPGGAITLTTGLASQYPSPAARSSRPSMPQWRHSCAPQPRSRRFPFGSTPFRQVGSPKRYKPWAAILPRAFRRPRLPRSPFANSVRARRGRWRPLRSKTSFTTRRGVGPDRKAAPLRPSRGSGRRPASDRSDRVGRRHSGPARRRVLRGQGRRATKLGQRKKRRPSPQARRALECESRTSCRSGIGRSDSRAPAASTHIPLGSPPPQRGEIERLG